MHGWSQAAENDEKTWTGLLLNLNYMRCCPRPSVEPLELVSHLSVLLMSSSFCSPSSILPSLSLLFFLSILLSPSSSPQNSAILLPKKLLQPCIITYTVRSNLFARSHSFHRCHHVVLHMMTFQQCSSRENDNSSQEYGTAAWALFPETSYVCVFCSKQDKTPRKRILGNKSR